jgi:hypothetical protein
MRQSNNTARRPTSRNDSALRSTPTFGRPSDARSVPFERRHLRYAVSHGASPAACPLGFDLSRSQAVGRGSSRRPWPLPSWRCGVDSRHPLCGAAGLVRRGAPATPTPGDAAIPRVGRRALRRNHPKGAMPATSAQRGWSVRSMTSRRGRRRGSGDPWRRAVDRRLHRCKHRLLDR